MRQHDRGEYPPDWAEIAQHTKEVAGWRCIRCGHVNEFETGHVLTVHHFDADKSNCRWWNLGALCQRCHLSIQGRVIMERTWMLPHSEWFRPYVADYYAFHNGLPDDREYVMQHIDYLIDAGCGRVQVTS
jgi:5-methylcytosine-specific restriction endonuclease McrA